MMRKLMWFSVGLGAACAFCAYFYVPWLMWIGIGTAVLFAAAMVASRYVKQLRVVCLILLGCFVGILWFWGYDQLYINDVRALDGGSYPIIAVAEDYPEQTDYGCAVNARLDVSGKTYRLRMYLNEEYSLSPGDSIAGNFRFRLTTDGGHDDPTNHRTEGIFLLAYVQGKPTIVHGDAVSWRDYPAVWRRDMLNSIDALFPQDAAGFASALLLGERSGVDYKLNTAFKVSGISHIIAVSGLHISILLGLVYIATWRRRYLTALIGIPVLILFAAIVGFTPSITRACIMNCLMLLAIVLNREYDPPTALGFAVVVMLLCNPLTVASVSFQLSVACMAGIFLFAVPIREWLTDDKRLGKGKGKHISARLKRWFASGVSVSIAASVITTPLVALYFGTVSLISVLTNLLTLWAVTVIFYGILLVLGLGAIFPLAGRVLAELLSWVIRYVTGTVSLLAEFPLAAVYTESVYIFLWLIGCYCMLAVFLLMKRKPVILLTCCAVISLCVALLASWAEPLLDPVRVTVLDVGQGQCILLQCDGRTFMVDCGGDSDTEAADKAAEHLLSHGVSRLDGLILTHLDADHAGGVEYLLQRIPVDVLYIPDVIHPGTEKLSNLLPGRVNFVDEDTAIRFGAGQIQLFAPETVNSGNESGLCVLFRKEKYDILITGDRGALGEMLLLTDHTLPQLELLIAGHHGAAGSNGEQLLAQTLPQYVIISVGEDNRYGHPASETLERLARFGCTVYRTDLNGTVIYRG